MKFPSFDLERIQSIYENSVEINLTESGIEPLSLKELMNPKELEEFIRVDHAGERGAIKIYEGQLLALNTLVNDEDLKKTMFSEFNKIR